MFFSHSPSAEQRPKTNMIICRENSLRTQHNIMVCARHGPAIACADFAFNLILRTSLSKSESSQRPASLVINPTSSYYSTRRLSPTIIKCCSINTLKRWFKTVQMPALFSSLSKLSLSTTTTSSQPAERRMELDAKRSAVGSDRAWLVSLIIKTIYATMI